MSTSYFSQDRRQPANGLKSPLLSPPPTVASPLSPLSPGQSRVNALQQRIASILSASYADLEISETLKTLDGRGIDNDAETRRNLRLDLQQDLIACDGEVVQDFGQVAAQLRKVGAALENLNKTCTAIRTHVNASRRETAPVLEEHKQLTDQRRQTETKQQLLKAFNAHFILSDAEVAALTSSAEPINDEFFAALNRTKTIHADSQVLLGSDNSTLGLEILDQSTRNLNAAYQKLFRWTQRELKTIDLENPQLSASIRHSLRVLAERPSLFQSCLDFFAESRESILSDAFYAALTGNVPSTSSSSVAVPSRAIELNAHEPLRYVSDLLAWLHAAAVGEREALQSLFLSADADEISTNLRLARQSQPWLHPPPSSSPTEDESFNAAESLAALVSRSLHSPSRLLRQRTEQTLRSHEDAVLAYQISNLCFFYEGIFSSLLGASSPLADVLGPLSDLALEQFRLVTRDHIASLHETSPPPDLDVPEFLEDAIDVLGKLMASYEGTGREVKADGEGEGFEMVLREALDPYLAGCENIARRMDSPDAEVFGLNCLLFAAEKVKGKQHLRERVEKMREGVELQRGRLVQSVRVWLTGESGLEELFAAVRKYSDKRESGDVDAAKELDMLTVEKLEQLAGGLDSFLPTSMEDARGIIEGLRDGTTARAICEEAADAFVEEFEELERVLEELDEIAEKNGEEKKVLLRDVFPRTGDEIKVLLS